MSLTATGQGSVSATVQWLHGLWEYYREYTHTALHAASAAALTIFGLLSFINRLFVVLAIAAYIGPPLILYSIGADVGKVSHSPKETTVRADSRTNANRESGIDADSDGRDNDSDSDDRDADSDGADADADSADADADADG